MGHERSHVHKHEPAHEHSHAHEAAANPREELAALMAYVKAHDLKVLGGTEDV